MSQDEAPVLQRVAAGDHQAVKECLDRFGGLVWTLARRALSSPEEAEDATQEILTEIWLSAGRYDPATGTETVFVATIARRRLIDRLRKKGRVPWTDSLEEPGCSWPGPSAIRRTSAPRRRWLQRRRRA